MAAALEGKGAPLPEWLRAHGVNVNVSEPAQGSSRRSLEALPRAAVIDIQARTHADRFDAMERPATRAEIERMLSAVATADASRALAPGTVAWQGPRRWLLFPESRQ